MKTMDRTPGWQARSLAVGDDRPLLIELADLLEAYDRTSILDPGLRPKLAQRRRRALERAAAALAREPIPEHEAEGVWVLWSFSAPNGRWLQVDQGAKADMLAGAERRNKLLGLSDDDDPEFVATLSGEQPG